MTDASERKEGELSAEESALAKKFFVAFGFILAAAVVAAFELFIDLPYVIFGVILVGTLVVVKVSFSSGNRASNSAEKTS